MKYKVMKFEFTDDLLWTEWSFTEESGLLGYDVIAIVKCLLTFWMSFLHPSSQSKQSKHSMSDCLRSDLLFLIELKKLIFVTHIYVVTGRIQFDFR